MTIVKWAALLLLAAPFLAGCGDFWQSPSGSSSSSTSGCTSNCTTATSGDFYILNSGTTPQIVGESIVSGTLTALSGSPWTMPATPYAMAMSPNGDLLFVSTTAGVYTYPISSGELEVGSATQVSTDTAALALHVDTTGSWLIEALQATGGVTFAAVPINSSTGADNGLEVTVTYTDANAAVQPGQLAISENGSYIFAALGSGGAIAVPFNANVSAGSSPFGTTGTVIPVTNSGGSVLSVAVDPTDRLFYLGETLANSAGNSGGLFAFNYSSLGSSTLTQASGSPIASAGLAPNFILPITSGDYVYVGNGEGTSSAGNITGFSVTANGSVYSLTSVSTVAAGTQPIGLAEDSTGTFVLGVSSLGNPYFDADTFDSTTGQLTSPITSDTGADPIAIVATPP